MSRLFTLTALASAVGMAGCFVSAIYTEDLPARAERVRTRTDDGWGLELVRYRPTSAPGGRPVLLVHGMSGNGRNLDLDDAHSLARWLSAHGREAWTLSLRDTGDSDRADPSHGRLDDYSIDSYLNEDLPAAIREVRRVTGSGQIDYVGHSLGGILLYAHLGGQPGDIGAGVALGSPGRFRIGGRSGWLARNLVAPAARFTGSARVEDLGHALSPLGGQIDLQEKLVANPADISPTTWRKFLAVGAGNNSAVSSRQLLGWVEADRFASLDGKIDYAQRLAAVHVPVLVVAGKIDRIADVSMVKAAYRRLAGPKEFLVAGVENGFAADYGHLDLIVGDHVGTDLWPRVGEFLERYR